MQIEDALERFVVHLQSEGRSEHTVRQYRRHVRRLAAWVAEVGHSGRVAEITDEDVAHFLASAQARTSARGGEKKASSLSCLRRSVQAFFRYVSIDCVPASSEPAVRQRSKGPKSAIQVTAYAELDQYVGAFARGHLNLLILVGTPGLQKSKAIRTAVGEGVCWIEGHATPFGIYRRLWEKRNLPVVIDDVDGLAASRDGLRLLKSLCQTEPLKCVSWHSDVATLRRDGIPRTFTTISRVAIIANEWRTLDRNVAAVEDRGICVVFEPTPLEIHVRTANWFWDQEVYDFVGKRLHLFDELSMRLYRQLWELKTAGIDWTAFALQRSSPGGRREGEEPPRIVLSN